MVSTCNILLFKYVSASRSNTVYYIHFTVMSP